ncbi:MAG: hypothetical protein Q8N42_01170 [bacterium]|nr:hypothetical protein [bacterium]
MQFYYKKFRLADGNEIQKPIIPIGLLFNGKSIKYEALVDSGADFNIFNAEIGEILGIDICSGEKMEFGGIAGNPFEVYLHNLTLEIGGWCYEIVAGFSYKISPYGFGILGQKGFFNLFRVKFLYSKGIIEVVPEAK